MSISPELWSSVLYAVVFLALILFPWAVGVHRRLAGFVGFGGLAVFVLVSYFVGLHKEDPGLGRDLILLDLLRAAFFFLASYLVERVFRLWLQYRKTNQAPESYADKVNRERFEREFRGLKSTDETNPKK
ncbi:MAG: hypothetical protein JJ879_13540 [Sneathiella sp.]|nr:hypothetical protein [Sneathiella sp.]